MMMSQAFAQHHVSTGTTKYVLLEEATGTWCGYCADGAQRVEVIKSGSSGPRTNVISWHGPTGYSEVMDLTGSPYSTLANYDSIGYPSGAVDRLPYAGDYSINRGYWGTAVSARMGATANFQVDLDGLYNTTNDTVTITVTGKALTNLTGSWRLNVYVVEDSISSLASGYQQHSYSYNDATSWYYHQCLTTCGSSCASCAILPDSIYSHMQVARAILATSGFWGDAAFTNPTTGTTFSKTYKYHIPSGSNPTFMKVVGVVQKYGTTAYDRPIENSITAKVRLMPASTLGVVPVNAMSEIEIFPNPAKNILTVKGTLDNPSETKIVISNVLGQTVFAKKFANGGSVFFEEIAVNNLANGVYLMNIVNNGETVTKKFVISR